MLSVIVEMLSERSYTGNAFE